MSHSTIQAKATSNTHPTVLDLPLSAPLLGPHLDTRVAALLRSIHRLLNPNAQPRKGRPPRPPRGVGNPPTPIPTDIPIDSNPAIPDHPKTSDNAADKTENDDDVESENDEDNVVGGVAPGDAELRRQCDGLLASVGKDIQTLVDIR